MQTVLNLLPLAAFGVAYHFGGIYAATAVLMLAMVLMLAVDWLWQRRIPPMHAYSTVLVLVFGTLTLVLHDPRFLKWKPSILLWSLALAFLVSQWIGRMNLAQRMFESALPEHQALGRSTWTRVNIVWTLAFVLLGALNLWVARVASEATWVHFKIFGLTLILMLLSVAQALWLQSRSQRA
jgi:intracellular septation protein